MDGSHFVFFFFYFFFYFLFFLFGKCSTDTNPTDSLTDKIHTLLAPTVTRLHLSANSPLHVVRPFAPSRPSFDEQREAATRTGTWKSAGPPAAMRIRSSWSSMAMPRCCPLACAAAGSSSTATQHAATAHGFVHIFCFVVPVVSEVPRWMVDCRIKSFVEWTTCNTLYSGQQTSIDPVTATPQVVLAGVSRPVVCTFTVAVAGFRRCVERVRWQGSSNSVRNTVVQSQRLRLGAGRTEVPSFDRVAQRLAVANAGG